MDSTDNSWNVRKQNRQLLFVEDNARGHITDYLHLRSANIRRLSTAIYVHCLLWATTASMKRLAVTDTDHFTGPFKIDIYFPFEAIYWRLCGSRNGVGKWETALRRCHNSVLFGVWFMWQFYADVFQEFPQNNIHIKPPGNPGQSHDKGEVDFSSVLYVDRLFLAVEAKQLVFFLFWIEQCREIIMRMSS